MVKACPFILKGVENYKVKVFLLQGCVLLAHLGGCLHLCLQLLQLLGQLLFLGLDLLVLLVGFAFVGVLDSPEFGLELVDFDLEFSILLVEGLGLCLELDDFLPDFLEGLFEILLNLSSLSSLFLDAFGNGLLDVGDGLLDLVDASLEAVLFLVEGEGLLAELVLLGLHLLLGVGQGHVYPFEEGYFAGELRGGGGTYWLASFLISSSCLLGSSFILEMVSLMFLAVFPEYRAIY